MYRLSIIDFIKYGMLGIAVCAVVSYTFYKSLIMFVILAPIAAVAAPMSMRERLKNERIRKLTDQFRETMLSVSAFLGAGISLENAFIKTYPEICRMYGRDALMSRELELIISRIRLNKPVEAALMDFATRSRADDIRNFTEVFIISKRRGGSMKEIIESTADVIRDKAAVNEEIRSMTASRRYEQNIMNLLPFAIIIYIDMTTDGFLNIMYECFAGRVIMTFCLSLTCVSYLLSQKLLNIRV
ncbi:MAG: type II secretion system F family protein [bacterium]|nr:type II secretion system F family protein [bacterium]